MEINNGADYFVYSDPEALKKDVRLTEANLNRMFKSEESISEKEKSSYEYARSRFLSSYLEKSDFFLDVHASTSKYSQRFIVCEENANLITPFFPVNLIVYGFDNVEPDTQLHFVDITRSWTATLWD